MSVKWKEVLKDLIPMIQSQYNTINGSITIRRAFYTAVSAGLIPNTDNYYITLSSQLARARENGLIPWEWLDDERRTTIEPKISPSNWYGVDAPYSAMNDPTREQEYYVEVWIEKDGSIPIIEPLCKKYFVRLVSSAGNSSVSYKYHSAQRFKEAVNRGQKVKLLYISDLDADGEHFPIELVNWMKRVCNVNVDVEKIILSKAQVNSFNLPILTKSYVKRIQRNVTFVQNFVSKYGSIQVELDAMPILDIRSILEEHLKKYIDIDIIKAIKKKSIEEATQNIIQDVAKFTTGQKQDGVSLGDRVRRLNFYDPKEEFGTIDSIEVEYGIKFDHKRVGLVVERKDFVVIDDNEDD